MAGHSNRLRKTKPPKGPVQLRPKLCLHAIQPAEAVSAPSALSAVQPLCGLAAISSNQRIPQTNLAISTQDLRQTCLFLKFCESLYIVHKALVKSNFLRDAILTRRRSARTMPLVLDRIYNVKVFETLFPGRPSVTPSHGQSHSVTRHFTRGAPPSEKTAYQMPPQPALLLPASNILPIQSAFPPPLLQLQSAPLCSDSHKNTAQTLPPPSPFGSRQYHIAPAAA